MSLINGDGETSGGSPTPGNLQTETKELLDGFQAAFDRHCKSHMRNLTAEQVEEGVRCSRNIQHACTNMLFWINRLSKVKGKGGGID